MGRRGVSLEEPSRWVFNRLAEDYRARPGYPAELLDRLAELGGGPGSTAVDLGAGTGLVALPLAARGVDVLAVEPARMMLQLLEEARSPRVVPIHASAEATGLAPAVADLAVLADALQWVDPDAAGREIARVLRPEGVVAVVEPMPAPGAFMTGLVALVESVNFKARRGAAEGRRRQLFGSARVREVRVERFAHVERLDPDRLDAVLRSLSLVGPALGERGVDGVLRKARELAEEAGGAVWAREIFLTWGRRG